MRGVYHADQIMGYYHVGRRSVKWLKRGASHILEVCLYNAYIIDQHDKVGSKKGDFLFFRIALAEELIGTFTTRVHSAGRPRTTTVEEIRLDCPKPLLPVVDGPKLECVVCCKVREVRGLTRREYRHESQIQCSLCGVHLCVAASRNCSQKYHTARRYWDFFLLSPLLPSPPPFFFILLLVRMHH